MSRLRKALDLDASPTNLQDGEPGLSCIREFEKPCDGGCIQSHPLARLAAHQMGVVYHTDINGTITAIIDEEYPIPTAAAMLRDLINIYWSPFSRPSRHSPIRVLTTLHHRDLLRQAIQLVNDPVNEPIRGLDVGQQREECF